MGAGAGQGVSAYATNSSSGTLSAVKAVSGSLFAAGTEPVGAAVDPTGKFVYVANNASNNLSAYTINSSTGALDSDRRFTLRRRNRSLEHCGVTTVTGR